MNISYWQLLQQNYLSEFFWKIFEIFLIKTPKNINQKINEIFSSSRYIYKADVEITLKSGKVVKRIVGKNSVHLITYDNELIPISDIVDIKTI